MIKNLTIIILTYNEEQKIENLLSSISGVTSDIFVVDSYSNDNTLEILKKHEVKVISNTFEGYSEQRNWAQKKDPFNNEWVMHLDADEPLTLELKNWLLKDFQSLTSKYDGFMFSRRVYFMNKWIRHGGQYPNYHLRLFKKHMGCCEPKAYDQHFIMNYGRVKKINNADIKNTVADNINSLIISHNKWASLEAYESVKNKKSVGGVKPSFWGNPIERKRWLNQVIFKRSPLFLRSFLYFFYLYILRLGFLDGKPGLIYFVLQSFWFRFLIDAKIYEIEKFED